MIPLPGTGPPGRAAAAVRRAGLWVAALMGCGVVLAAAASFAGSFGLVIAADSLAGLALALLLARVPQGGRGLPHPFPGTALARAVLRHGWLPRFLPWARRHPPVKASDFPAFLKISSDLGWASVSRWHYDHGTRPLLARIMRAALAERHRLDTAADAARARELVGDDIWPFLDPSVPACRDSRTPGPDLRGLTRIVERLESL